MQIFNVFKFTWLHPLNRNGRLKALFRILRWQIAARLLPEASILLPFVGGAGLLVSRGMTGATGNWYCGLDEMEDMALVLHAMRPGELFLDVGANIGSYSILAAAGVGAHVIAVEPIFNTFSHLSANIRVNDLNSLISAQRLGLSEKPGILSFTTAYDTVNHVLAEGEDADSQPVNVTTMDMLCETHSPVVIKIDVEGHELPVLRGAVKTMANPALLAVIIELNGSGVRYGLTNADIDAWMISNGFERCSYSPLNRKLKRRKENSPLPITSGNVLYVRDFVSLERRLQAAPSVSLVNCKI